MRVFVESDLLPLMGIGILPLMDQKPVETRTMRDVVYD